MKNTKGFIQIPLLIAIIAGILVLSGAGYFGIQKYQNYQAEKVEQKKQAELNQKADEEQQQKLQGLLDSQTAELEKQKSAIEALKNKKPEIITQTIIKEAPAQKTENDLPTIINQWKNNIAEITCEWQYSNGVAYVRAKGSGYIISSNGLGELVLTNRHVVIDDSFNGTEYTPAWCVIKVYGIGEMKVYLSKSDNPLSVASSGVDWASIKLTKGTPGNENPFRNLPTLNSCHGADIGDKVIILGYPSIGTSGGITATEGIISGIENEYYVTSAKIDHGNSGGVAVLVRENCYLGIPSAANVGTIESLGRILKGSLIFTSQ